MEKQLTLTENTTFVDVYEEVAQDLTCDAFKQTIAIINNFYSDGDITPFKDKQVQENIYNTFCLVDWLKRLSDDIKNGITEIVNATKKVDEDGKSVTGMYGLKIKNNGSTTKITDSYVLIQKICGDDPKLNAEEIFKKCSITIKNLAKACGRSEEYLKKEYSDYIVVEKKAESVQREF